LTFKHWLLQYQAVLVTPLICKLHSRAASLRTGIASTSSPTHSWSDAMTNDFAPVSATVPTLLTLWPQTAHILGLSRQAIYRAASRGDLPLWPAGGRRKVVTAKLEEKIGRPIVPADLD
jgi:hypothetical protein